MSRRNINGTVALVTGANRGIGRAIVEALLERGAAKVYATARNPETLQGLVDQHGARVVPLKLDVTDERQLNQVVTAAGDVQLVFNNAGVALGQDVTAGSIVDQARQEMEVNYFGPLRLMQQLSSTLGGNGGGAVINVSSIAGLTNFPMLPTYSASKAAVHSLTQAARTLLSGQGTAVYGVYPGPVDTDMAAEVPFDKASPQHVAAAILDGIEAGRNDIFPDPFAEEFNRQFQSSPKASEEQIAAMVLSQTAS